MWIATVLPVVSILLLSGVEPLAAQATGRIEGTATISPLLNPSHSRVRVYTEPGVRLSGKTKEHQFERVVFYLEPSSALRGTTSPASAPAPVMKQNDGAFVPHVLPVIAGTRVDFPNEDPVYHNVFSLSRNESFDLGRYPRGRSKSNLFEKPGIVQVFCHIHSDMSGYVLVLENSFYVVPDAQGAFAIENVPPGTHNLVIWHERIRPVKQPVTVTAGGTSRIQVRVPIQETTGGR